MDLAKQKKHNGVLSIWKFIFALMIILHHFYEIHDKTGVAHDIFKCGAIAVDFFFIVSGYLLARKVASENRRGDQRDIPQATFDFIKGKIVSVFPYLLFSVIIFASLCIYLDDRTKTQFLGGFIDLSFIQMAGFPNEGFVGGAWYLSAMILAMVLVYPLQKKYGRTFTYIIAPLIVIFVGGYAFHSVKSFRAVKGWLGSGWGYVGLYKAIFEISVGCMVYEMAEKLRKVNFTKFGKLMLSMAEIICLGFVISVNLIYNDVRKLDWLFIFLLVFGVAIAASENTFFFNAASNRLFFYLEKLSLPMFLNNYIPIKISNNFEPMKSWDWDQKAIFVFCAVIILSAIELIIVKYVLMLVRFLRKKISKLIIVQTEE